jgi:predicted RNA-binding protein with PIN domain
MGMPLLIDGHNLIARLPDLHLDDPDDEAKLVERLRRHQARTGKRLIVVFDRGLPGGVEPDLSTGNVQVVFAATGRSADALIIERVRRSRDARGLTIVTSDQRIITTVEPLGARVMRSEIFAAKLADELGTSPAPDEIDDAVLSQSEVDEWLAVFEEKSLNNNN